MAINQHNSLETFAVLKPDQTAETVTVSPTLYAALDQDFDGFQGHSLMAVHEFSESWSMWERHPAGDEIVMLLSGRATLVLKTDEGEEVVTLETAGAYVIVPKGVWHTAKVSEPTRMLFITPGEGTENSESPD